MADLVAFKHVTYAGRVIRPGVVFRASPAHARVLVATGFAGLVREFPRPAQPSTNGSPTPLQEPAAVPSIDDLRAAYTAKAGKAPDSRWREKRLAKEIAAL
jgi:hypothetical protein